MIKLANLFTIITQQLGCPGLLFNSANVTAATFVQLSQCGAATFVPETSVPGDNCPRDICPRDNCPRDNCPRGQLSQVDFCPRKTIVPGRLLSQETIVPGEFCPREFFVPGDFCPRRLLSQETFFVFLSQENFLEHIRDLLDENLSCYTVVN